MQILVVVANIQMRTLKTDVGKGSMRTAIGHGLIGPKAKADAESKRVLHSRCRKGKWLISHYQFLIRDGNVNNFADISMSYWKSSLFFLTDYDPGIGLTRDRVVCQAEQVTLRLVSCAHDDH